MIDHQYDEFGFVRLYDDEHNMIYYEKVKKQIAQNDKVWFKYTETQGGSSHFKLDDKKFKKQIRKGIPMEVRPLIWAKITKLYEIMDARANIWDEAPSKFNTIHEDVKRTIDVDIPRTFPRNKAFSSEYLKKILYVFAVAHPEIGYCQSLNFVAAICLFVMKSDIQAFYLLLIIVENYLPKGYFTPDMKDYQTDICMLQILINERQPEVAAIAKAANYQWAQCTSNWILTLFSNTLPVSTVMRIWDSFFLEGQKVIFRVALAILKINNDLLKAAKPSDFTKVLKTVQGSIVDQEQLMTTAFGLKAFSRAHLKALREKAVELVEKSGPTVDGQPISAFHSFLGRMNI
ncbi:TBC domain containing protein [Trichomonas vaginalis G3]|uniref:TBC domain containing protein n=1 Tax=Trichomonas vaginalis (strain ATCC PRA-98 / G3) TaxID=412133 RepID=A2FGC2_TRIV3|nr:activation of GTPase protein [Trichomonas vaginalis G3]EAX96068.1 TBC domain containing protein [Trichomonas vaginalis G3]KAI5504012.1 activation of GTPase protein [Trichomonas vaginalis G3]|eukprot:XP_001308998.1 TBC domain containing protein [Trichomonas vaginalis G3]